MRQLMTRRDAARENGKKGGRPKGSFSKPRFADYVSEQQVNSLVKKALQMANDGNETMLKFVIEQKFGKAVQTVAGDVENPIAFSTKNKIGKDWVNCNNKYKLDMQVDMIKSME